MEAALAGAARVGVHGIRTMPVIIFGIMRGVMPVIMPMFAMIVRMATSAVTLRLVGVRVPMFLFVFATARPRPSARNAGAILTASTDRTHAASPSGPVCRGALALLRHTSFQRPSLDHQIADPHFASRNGPHSVASASCASIEESAQGRFGLTLQAPAFARHRNDLEPASLGNATACHGIEAKAQGLAFDTRQFADLQPHDLDAAKRLLGRGVLDDLHYAFG